MELGPSNKYPPPTITTRVTHLFPFDSSLVVWFSDEVLSNLCWGQGRTGQQVESSHLDWWNEMISLLFIILTSWHHQVSQSVSQSGYTRPDQSQYNNIIQLRFSSITKHCAKSRNNISQIISQKLVDRFKFAVISLLVEVTSEIFIIKKVRCGKLSDLFLLRQFFIIFNIFLMTF